MLFRSMFITAWARKQVIANSPTYHVILTISTASLREDIDTEGADKVVRVLGEQALEAVRALEGEEIGRTSPAM